MEPKEDKPSVAQLRSLLNRSTRIKITDGRLFIGQFMCIDHSKNIILSAAYEYRTIPKNTIPDNSVHDNTGDRNNAGDAAGDDVPLKTLSSNISSSDLDANVLAGGQGQGRKKEEEGKYF
ncbi:hypothetical protein FBU30_002766 [Linnemannia zychae]|nr:hypothetical protein FBU30_002766 [Linnemannia zychae]